MDGVLAPLAHFQPIEFDRAFAGLSSDDPQADLDAAKGDAVTMADDSGVLCTPSLEKAETVRCTRAE
jgi:hypothetical protein